MRNLLLISSATLSISIIDISDSSEVSGGVKARRREGLLIVCQRNGVAERLSG